MSDPDRARLQIQIIKGARRPSLAPPTTSSLSPLSSTSLAPLLSTPAPLNTPPRPSPIDSARHLGDKLQLVAATMPILLTIIEDVVDELAKLHNLY